MKKSVKNQVKKMLLIGCIVSSIFTVSNLKTNKVEAEKSDFITDYTMEYAPSLEKTYKKQLEKSIKNPDMNM